MPKDEDIVIAQGGISGNGIKLTPVGEEDEVVITQNADGKKVVIDPTSPK